MALPPSAAAAATAGLLAALGGGASGMAYAADALEALPPAAIAAVRAAGGVAAFCGAYLHRRVRFCSVHGGREDMSVLAPTEAGADDVLAFLSLPPPAAVLHAAARDAARGAALALLRSGDGDGDDSATTTTTARGTAHQQQQPQPSAASARTRTHAAADQTKSVPLPAPAPLSAVPMLLRGSTASLERSPGRPPSPRAVASELVRVLADLGGMCDADEAFESLFRRMPAARVVVGSHCHHHHQHQHHDDDANAHRAEDTTSESSGKRDGGVVAFAARHAADEVEIVAPSALRLRRQHSAGNTSGSQRSSAALRSTGLQHSTGPPRSNGLTRSGVSSGSGALAGSRASPAFSAPPGGATITAAGSSSPPRESSAVDEATDAAVVDSLVRVLRRQGGRCEVARLFALVERRLPGTASLVRRAGGVPTFLSRFPGHFDVVPAVPGGATIVRLSAPAAAAAILASSSTPGSTPAVTPGQGTPVDGHSARGTPGAGTPVRGFASAAFGSAGHGAPGAQGGRGGGGVQPEEEEATVAALARILREHGGACSASAVFAQLYAEMPTARAVVIALGRSRNFVERHAALFVFDDTGRSGIVRLVGAAAAAAAAATAAAAVATSHSHSHRDSHRDSPAAHGHGAAFPVRAGTPGSDWSRSSHTTPSAAARAHAQHLLLPPSRASPMGSTMSAPAGALPSEAAVAYELGKLLREAGGRRGAPQLFAQLYHRLRGARDVIALAGRSRTFLARHSRYFEWVMDGAGGVVRLVNVPLSPQPGDKGAATATTGPQQPRTPASVAGGGGGGGNGAGSGRGSGYGVSPVPGYGNGGAGSGSMASPAAHREQHVYIPTRNGIGSMASPAPSRELNASVAVVLPAQRSSAAVTNAVAPAVSSLPTTPSLATPTNADIAVAARTTTQTEHSRTRTQSWVSAMAVSPPDHVDCTSPAASAPSCPSPAPSGASSVPASARAAEAARFARAAAASVAAASASAAALELEDWGSAAEAEAEAEAVAAGAAATGGNAGSGTGMQTSGNGGGRTGHSAAAPDYAATAVSGCGGGAAALAPSVEAADGSAQGRRASPSAGVHTPTTNTLVATTGTSTTIPPAAPTAATPNAVAYVYPPGCWAPHRPEGARVYPVEFLMQFQRPCAAVALASPLLQSMRASGGQTGGSSGGVPRGWCYSGSYHGGLARFHEAPPMASLSVGKSRDTVHGNGNGTGNGNGKVPPRRLMGTQDFLQNHDTRVALLRLTPHGWSSAGCTWQGLPESELLLVTFAVRSALQEAQAPPGEIATVAATLGTLSATDVSEDALRHFVVRYGARVGCQLQAGGNTLAVAGPSNGNSPSPRTAGTPRAGSSAGSGAVAAHQVTVSANRDAGSANRDGVPGPAPNAAAAASVAAVEGAAA